MPTELFADEDSKKRKLDDVEETADDEELKEPESKKIAADNSAAREDGAKPSGNVDSDVDVVVDADANANANADANTDANADANGDVDADVDTTMANNMQQHDHANGNDAVKAETEATPVAATEELVNGVDDAHSHANSNGLETSNTPTVIGTTLQEEAEESNSTDQQQQPEDGENVSSEEKGTATAGTTAAAAEDDDEVIVIATKNAPVVAVNPNDSASVAAAVAAAAATPPSPTKNSSETAISSMIQAATNNVNNSINTNNNTILQANNESISRISPQIDSVPFPKLDEASMSGMSQSERKRYREKKRRSEITQAIDKLTKILLKVEPANLFSQNNLVYSTNTSDLIPSRGGRSGGSGQQPLNRTEIINHAVKVLEKLHRENEERKMQLMRLHSVVGDAAAAGATVAAAGSQPAMMMMPAQPMIYQTAPQAKMPAAAAFNATAIPVQAVPTLQMAQHPASFMQTATAYHVSSSGAPVDTMPKGMVMVPATAGPVGPAAGAPPPHHAAVADAGAQQQRAYEQFYISQQLQQQRMREVGKM